MGFSKFNYNKSIQWPISITSRMIHRNKEQNPKLKIETPADKIKSSKDLKRELKAFFSFNGHSAVLDTK